MKQESSSQLWQKENGINQIRAWLFTIRPKTFSASIGPVLVAVALAQTTGVVIDWVIAFLTIASALCIQVATNLINDAYDFKRGADDADRLGPKRGLQLGLLTARQVWMGSFFCLAVALLLGIPLVLKGGWPILAVLGCSIVCAYIYTGGPFPLAYHGLGDVFAFLFFGWGLTLSAYYLQTGHLDQMAWTAGSQMGALAMALIAMNNLRDIEGDSRVGKKTLAARFGLMFGRLEISFLILLTFICNMYWWMIGYTYAAFFPLVLLPLAYSIVHFIWTHKPSTTHNLYLARIGLLQVGFSLLLFLGYRMAVP